MLAVAGGYTCDALAVAVILSLSDVLATRELGGVIEQRGQAQPACLQQWHGTHHSCPLPLGAGTTGRWRYITPRTRTKSAVVAGAKKARIDLPERNIFQGSDEADRLVRRWMLDPDRKRPHAPRGELAPTVFVCHANSVET